MATHVLVKIEEVSALSKTLELDLTRMDGIPISTQRILERVNAMIECLMEADESQLTLDDILDYLAEEYGECLSALHTLEELMAVCQQHSHHHTQPPARRLAQVRVLDCQGDVVLTLT